MKKPAVIFPRLFLALLLIVTSQTMAIARGASGPAGQMILCTGTGPVQVFVDEDGQPTGPPHYCPECALAFADCVDAPNASLRKIETQSRLDPVNVATQARQHRTPRAIARAPPCSV